MAIQNTVSASMTAVTKTEIMEAFATIKGKMNFLLTLQADEVKGLFKAGKEFVPFIDECSRVATAHPGIVSGVFDLAEFERDHQLSQDLSLIADAANQLTDAINNTLMAARSDALVGALDIYAGVKLNRDKVPGLNRVCDTLCTYFKRPSRPAAAKLS